MGKNDPLAGMKSVVLREAAVTAHADWYSKYIDLQGWHDAVIEVEVAADGNLNGSNYWELFLMDYDSTTPGTHTNYSKADDADVDYEIVTAAGASTVIRAANNVKIDSTSEDSVIVRYRYKGTSRYLHVFGDVTTAGSYPTGVVSVVAHLFSGREKPEDLVTPTTGTVS